MKRLFALFLALVISVIAAPIVSANTLITLAAPTSRLATGIYLNNDLALSIAPEGKFGALVNNPGPGTKTWVIDPAFLEEVLDLADGYVYLDENGDEVSVEQYEIAQQWFNLFVLRSRNDQLVATAYGAPALGYLKRYAPGELAVYNQLSKMRLETLMGRAVSAPGSQVIATETQLWWPATLTPRCVKQFG